MSTQVKGIFTNDEGGYPIHLRLEATYPNTSSRTVQGIVKLAGLNGEEDIRERVQQFIGKEVQWELYMYEPEEHGILLAYFTNKEDASGEAAFYPSDVLLGKFSSCLH
jgi:hypothetical protein